MITDDKPIITDTKALHEYLVRLAMEAFGRWVNDRATLDQPMARDYFTERMSQAAQTITNEVEELRDDLHAASIHSCSAACQRPTCVIRRERDALAAQLAALRRVMLPCSICRGRGVYWTTCTLCGDSTLEHECDSKEKPCPAPACGDLRRALADTAAAAEAHDREVRAQALEDAAKTLDDLAADRNVRRAETMSLQPSDGGGQARARLAIEAAAIHEVAAVLRARADEERGR